MIFREVEFPDLRRWHSSVGGRDLSVYQCDSGESLLHVFIGNEPFKKDGGYGWHMSVSRQPGCGSESDLTRELAFEIVKELLPDVELELDESTTKEGVIHLFEKE